MNCICLDCAYYSNRANSVRPNYNKHIKSDHLSVGCEGWLNFLWEYFLLTACQDENVKVSAPSGQA